MIGAYAIANSSGIILRVVCCGHDEADLQCEANEAAVAANSETSDLTHYVSGGQVVPKQTMPLQTTSPQITADGVDECVIGNIPAGVSVTWPDGQTDEVTDGEVRFSVDLPSTYTLKFTAIAYLDQEVTIEAVAAT